MGRRMGWDSTGWQAVGAPLIEAIVGQKFPVYTGVELEVRVAVPRPTRCGHPTAVSAAPSPRKLAPLGGHNGKCPFSPAPVEGAVGTMIINSSTPVHPPSLGPATSLH